MAAPFDHLLARGERIRAQATQHPTWLARRLLLRLLQGVLLLWLSARADAPWVGQALSWSVLHDLGLAPWLAPIPGWFQLICGALITWVVFLALLDVLSWRTAHFLLTDERVVIVRGAFTRVALDIPLEKIEEVALAQDPLARFVRYGDLVVRTAAAGDPRVLEYLCEALEFKHALERHRRARIERLSSPAARTAPG